MNNPFNCPYCKAPIDEHKKSIESCFEVKKGIPVLIKNYADLESELVPLRETMKDWYSTSQLEYLSGPFRHHVKLRIKYLSGIINKYFYDNKKHLKFLDIGCGDGFNLTWLKDFFPHIYASDYNFCRAYKANSLCIAKTVVLGDITDYPAADNSFDVVFFHHVLEHIPDDQKAMQEVYRILNKGGICILGVPNEGAVWWQLAYRFEPHTKKTSDHVHFYTLDTIADLSQKIGFKIKETKRLGYGIPHWSYDARLRQYKIIHDILEFIGGIFYPSQASSLYLILEK